MAPTGRAPTWPEVRALFDEVVELAPTRQAERLAIIGSAEPELRSAVERLLAGDAGADERLARVERALSPQGSERPERAAHGIDPLNLTGHTVSHFRVLEPIAVGGMGVVYRAEDLRLGRAIALKLPLPERCMGRDARERFMREGRAVGALDHPNVCAVHEVGESEEGLLYLAMTLYPGETLGARLAREGALPVPQALEIARAIARGLGAAHAAGIVHRDVKPANVMLLPDGGVKVLDFGLAKARDLSLTAPSAMMGTASYMAPEQIRGMPADARIDVWALGVVLYEMLTGSRPFDGERDVSIAHAILHDEPVRPRELRPDVSPPVERVVRSMLEKNPARRPATANAVESELGAALRPGRHASSWIESGGRWARPGWRGVGTTRRVLAVSAAVIVVAIGAQATRWFRHGARAASTTASRIALAPTSNAQAYEYFLRGYEYEQRAATEESLRGAQSLYLRALALDSTFALARARLAITYNLLLHYEPALAAQVRVEAEAALRMQPALGEAHLALGHALAMEGQHDQALEEFRLATRAMSTAEPHRAIASALLAQNRWEEGIAVFERAARIDPRDVSALRSLAIAQSRLRRYEAAVRTWDRVIDLVPDDHYAKLIRGHTYIRWQGSADTLAAALQQIPPEWDSQGAATWARFNVARIQRRPADALAALAASRVEASYDVLFYRPRALMQAQVYATMGDVRRARERYEAARVQLEAGIATEPSYTRRRIALGLAFAGLGRRRDAIEQARRAMASAPLPGPGVTGRLVGGAAATEGAAEVLTQAGDHDGALALLEQLLGVPAGREASVPLLRVDPIWDPLRSDPRFERMLRRYAER